MNNRITRKNLDGLFPTFCKTMGFRPATAWNDVGGMQIVGSSGLFHLEIIDNAQGGVRTVGGSHSAKELYDHMHFTIDMHYALEESERINKGLHTEQNSVGLWYVEDESGQIIQDGFSDAAEAEGFISGMSYVKRA